MFTTLNLLIKHGYPPVGSGATKGVLSERYPPVGSGATKGVLSEGYMLDCLLVRIRSCIKNRNVPSFPTKFMAEKHGGNFRAFYTASDDRISLTDA